MLVNRPPMGWNSWNTFANNVNETVILEMADTIVEKGYLDAGYEYVVIDDCWSLKERDGNGRLVPDPVKFPHGMKYVADYIHKKGLKFGMYSCAGLMTCEGYPSSFEHEYVDAATFAEWEIDFLKYDFCFFPKTSDPKVAYLTMANALRSTGRDILFSACNWGKDEPWRWMRSVGAHMYRSTGDIFDNYRSFTDIFKSQEENFSMSGPQCFNDLDMLIVGLYGNGLSAISREMTCTDGEYALHFALWCMMGTPLMMGADIRNVSEYCERLMKNRELIAINQDPECRPPVIYRSERDQEGTRILFKLLSNNEYALCLVNFSDRDAKNFALYFKELGIPYASGMYFDGRDVMTGEAVKLRDYLRLEIPAHSFKLYRGRLSHV